ncbi:hypothetical protein [Hydrogenophaga sp.]|jgi:hypothetical protein|uniref:hypothetical protein n=1 Tax=Hydrogenophaga sp. TaxID=1904254 RepID=UPI00271C7C2D|nr:hypothetical protein [Hydrogenophaga sp.]MDO9133691.1 hypothetical protein [Hydrogenophaga sp.]MDO9507366.1 hypothetical protein [Hydrogenophaga sp.]MDP3625342.1 hypothetical protein [Hydrogenophaga sp.]
MTDADLDRSYSALCEALTRVGEDKAPLFLSMLCLSLISRLQQADEVLPLMAHAERQCADGAGDGR